MATFSYTALKSNNDIVKGKIDALDARAARQAIKQMGLTPTLIIDESNKGAKEQIQKSAFSGKISAMSLKDKIEFVQTLQILTSTGIPIIETLVFLESNASTKGIRNVAFAAAVGANDRRHTGVKFQFYFFRKGFETL